MVTGCRVVLQGKWRRPLVLLALLAAAGCGAPAAARPAPPASPPPSSAQQRPAAAASSPLNSPTVPPPSPQPPVQIPPAPATAAPAPLVFPLTPVAEVVRGQVTVTPGVGAYTLQVQASGLVPGSVHSVHLHFGNCPSTGVHISVLGTVVGDAAGSGSLTLTLQRPYFGNGRFVIVYAGRSAGTLAACAQLAG